MAYHVDPYDNSLVIDGFEQGIANSPYNGIADMRNVNIISIPGEASVNFATSRISNPTTITTGTVTSANAGTDTITYTGATGLEGHMAVVFAGGSLPTGISAGTIYWVGSVTLTTFQIYSDVAQGSLVDITGNGTGTFTVYQISQPKYFTYDSQNRKYYMVDSAGLVWGDKYTTSTNNYWVYMGNKPNNNSNGNGIVYYQASDSTGYVFVLSNSSIDYTKTGTINWQYDWIPSSGTVSGYSSNPLARLKTSSGTNNIHEAFCAPTNQVVFCDANWVDRFYEKNPATAFDPTVVSTYVWDQTALLPTNDTAQSLTYLGTSYLVGGTKNVIYPWDGVRSTFNYPILIAENNIVKMVTVNTNTFIFAGNRGRIYITNGSQANLYKKVPDHISGTIEPYFTWGGATFLKNQLYFSLKATTNGNSAINQYGGVWAIDLDTNALRLTNQLSYGTYAGYATAIIANFVGNPGGTGLYMGWDNGSSAYGVDTTSSSPYTGGQATIDSDLIPIGTFDKPRDFSKLEYRLTRPLVSGESITIKTRLIFNTQDTGYTTTLTDSTVGHYSNSGDINFANAQWLQFQIVLNSTASSPSYVRLKEIRVLNVNT